MPVSAGVAASRCVNASRPPADAPTHTTGNDSDGCRWSGAVSSALEESANERSGAEGGSVGGGGELDRPVRLRPPPPPEGAITGNLPAFSQFASAGAAALGAWTTAGVRGRRSLVRRPAARHVPEDPRRGPDSRAGHSSRPAPSRETTTHALRRPRRPTRSDARPLRSRLHHIPGCERPDSDSRRRSGQRWCSLPVT